MVFKPLLQSLVKETEESVVTILNKVLKGYSSIVPSNNTLPSIPLLERTDQLKKVVSIVGENLFKISGLQSAKGFITGKAKTDLIIPTFAGGSGIGKVMLFLYVLFSNLIDKTWI